MSKTNDVIKNMLEKGPEKSKKVYEEDESLPYLTPNQKRFCRLYLQYKSIEKKDKKRQHTPAHILAAHEVFTNQKTPTTYGGHLIKHVPKIQQYIDYLQEDAYETVRDEEGRQQLTVTARARDYIIDIIAAKKAKNFQAVASMRAALDNLIGKKRRHAFMLATLKNIEDRRLALLDSVTSGEIDAEEFKILNAALEDSGDKASSDMYAIVKLHDNDRINQKAKDGPDDDK